MNYIERISKLWQYLKIQDNEILVIQAYNPIKETDEYLVSEMTSNGIQTEVSSTLLDFRGAKKVRFIQQLDDNKRHVIPSVEDMKRDKKLDY